MSVRLGLLALLVDQPMHGYQLRQEFEARTGGTWPLNIGQVYTTLSRLVRDGLVEPAAQGAAGPFDVETHTQADDDGRTSGEQFQLTEAGRSEIDRWWATPVLRGAPARDELAIKLALAVTVPGVDVVAVVQRQRTETMRALRDYTLLKRAADGGLYAQGEEANADLAWSLVLDNLVFSAEAEMRWLDHVEARLGRAARFSQRSRAVHRGVEQPGRVTDGAVPEAHDTPGAKR